MAEQKGLSGLQQALAKRSKLQKRLAESKNPTERESLQKAIAALNRGIALLSGAGGNPMQPGGAVEIPLTGAQKMSQIEGMGSLPEPKPPKGGDILSGLQAAAQGVYNFSGPNTNIHKALGSFVNKPPQNAEAGQAPTTPPPPSGGEPPASASPFASAGAGAPGAGAGEPQIFPQPESGFIEPDTNPGAREAQEMRADQTPELGAFKALLEAPAPQFQKAAFSPMEAAALGLLAGLRGVEATLPFIEQRRADARLVYDQARTARAEKLGGLFNLAQIAEQNRRQTDVQAHQIRLEKMRQEGALERAKASGTLHYPPGFAAAQKERRSLLALRGVTREALGLIRQYPGLTGPLDQYLLAHPTSEGRAALRRMESLLATISSTMASTESGGKNLTEIEMQIFGGRFPLLSNLGATVKARLEAAVGWYDRRISGIEADFPSMRVGGQLFPGAPAPPLPSGWVPAGDWQLGEEYDPATYEEVQ
jgi:hypothetical protein